jgi:hypothetical protein
MYELTSLTLKIYTENLKFYRWLSLDAYIVGVERKTMFKTRAEDSNKVLLTGPSEISRTLESTIFQKAGLDGSGVGVGIFHNRVGV